MMTSLLLGAALAAPGAPIPKDANLAPAGPAPWVLYLKCDNTNRTQLLIYKNQKVTINRQVAENVNGKAVVKFVQEQVDQMAAGYYFLDTLNPKFTTVQGGALTNDSVMKRAREGLVVLVSADGKPVSKSWLRTMDPETVIVTSPGLVSPVAPRGLLNISSLAPRLVLLGTGAEGKVQIAYNPVAGNNNMYDGRMNRVMFINNGNGVQQVFMNGGMNFDPSATTVVAPVKPLEEIKFDAFNLEGKAVAKAEAMQRLKAGGFALVAGDTSVPDPAYLKLFRGELLVLSASELVNVPTGTKGSKPAANQAAVAPALMLPPLAAPAPAQLIKVAAVRGAVLKAQPIREAPAAPVAKPVAPAPRTLQK